MAVAAAIPWIWAAVGAALAVAKTASDISANNAQAGAAIDSEKYNRELLKKQAGNEALLASLQEDQQRREAAFSQARTRAGLLQAGIGNLKGGSAVAVSGQAARFAELDALNIRWEGTQRFTALMSQADQAQVNIEGIRSQRTANKTSSLLEGASTIASIFAGGGGGALAKTAGTQGTGAPKAGYTSPTSVAARDPRGIVTGRARYYQPSPTSSRPRVG